MIGHRDPRVDPAIACAALHPEAHGRALGAFPRGSVPLHGPTIDGRTFDLAALKGKVVLVAFEASWDQLTKQEQPTLAAAATALAADVAVVRVASEETLADARAAVPASAGYTTVWDAAQGTCSPLGLNTTRWGVTAVPESFLVDRAGNVRFYFVNKRDWSSPEALACVRSLISDELPAIASDPAVEPAPCPNGGKSSPDHVLQGTLTFPPGAKIGTTVFLLVKRRDAAGKGTGLPLAVTRLTYVGKDFAFVLDDSMTLVEGAALTGEVVVSARYDQDGDAMTKQSGDLVGEVLATVPASGLVIKVETPLP